VLVGLARTSGSSLAWCRLALIVIVAAAVVVTAVSS
jgi:hypothetical protein